MRDCKRKEVEVLGQKIVFCKKPKHTARKRKIQIKRIPVDRPVLSRLIKIS